MRHVGVTGLLLALAFGTAAPGQELPSLPPVEVTAPRRTEPAPQPDPQPPPPEPPPQLPSYLQPTTASSPFTFNGSPLGQFNYVTPSITGTPTDMFSTPRSYTTLDATRINQMAPATTPQIFQQIPGVFVQRTNPGGGSLVIRGRSGKNNLLMIDGVPINDTGWRFANVQYLNTIDPGTIDRVEVIRGPASVLYGSGAVGGAVNIITKRRQNYEESFDAETGFITRFNSAFQESYNRAEISGNLRNMGVQAGGSYLSNGTWFSGGGVSYPSNTVSYDQRAADVRVDYLLGNDWTLTCNYQYSMQPLVPRTDRFPLAEVDPTRFLRRPTYIGPQERHFTYARLSYADDDNPWINGVQITGDFQQRREGEHEVRLDRTPTQETLAFEKINYGGIDVRAYTNITQRNSFLYGFTYYLDTVGASRSQRRGSAPFTAITPELPPDGRFSQFGLFFTDRWQMTDAIALNGGIRYGYVNASGTAGVGSNDPRPFNRHFDELVGEGGIVVALTDNFHWFSNISQGFYAPNLSDLASDDRGSSRGDDFGVIGLDSERNTNYETGIKTRSELFSGAATYYYTYYPSQIVRIPQPNNTNIRTNTSGFIHGVELEGDLCLTSWWSLYTTASQTFGQDTTLNEPLSRINPAFMTLGSRWSHKGPRVGLFMDAWTEMAGKQTRLSASDRLDVRIPIGGNPAWQTANIRWGIDAGSYGRLIIGLYNIFDQNYRVFNSGVDAPGIDLNIGYDVRF